MSDFKHIQVAKHPLTFRHISKSTSLLPPVSPPSVTTMALSLSAASHSLCSSSTTRVSLPPAAVSSSSSSPSSPSLVSFSSSHSLSPLRSLASSSSLFPHSPSLVQRKHTNRGSSNTVSPPTRAAASDAAQLKSAKEDIKVLLRTKFCHPILVKYPFSSSDIMFRTGEDIEFLYFITG